MKYIGEKSVSSFISGLIRVVWWLALAAGAFYIFALFVNLFSIGEEAAVTSTINRWDMGQNGTNLFLFFKWETIVALPAAAKAVIAAVWLACLVLNLLILRKAQHLFTNLKNDIVFDEKNVNLIATISKLLIAASILTWSLYTLVVSVLLLVLCQVFKRGEILQEDHDLTV
jgi:hypothetical protein